MRKYENGTADTATTKKNKKKNESTMNSNSTVWKVQQKFCKVSF